MDAHQVSEIINYCISLAIFIGIIFLLRKKKAENPDLKFSGISAGAIIKLCYAGCAIFLLLILKVVFNW